MYVCFRTISFQFYTAFFVQFAATVIVADRQKQKSGRNTFSPPALDTKITLHATEGQQSLWTVILCARAKWTDDSMVIHYNCYQIQRWSHQGRRVQWDWLCGGWQLLVIKAFLCVVEAYRRSVARIWELCAFVKWWSQYQSNSVNMLITAWVEHEGIFNAATVGSLALASSFTYYCNLVISASEGHNIPSANSCF